MTTKKIEVHEAANAFRLMNEDELARLAEDIAEHGLRDPITIGKVNGSQKLVDGRNRLKACQMASVEPRFEVKEFSSDEEIRAFIRSRSERRDISAGQRAMAMAFLYPEPDKRGRGNKGKCEDSAQFSKRRLEQARQVLRYSREWAEQVRDGSATLDDALNKVKKEQAYKASDEGKLAELEQNAPDLVELVREERLKVGEAYATWEERKRQQAERDKNQRETVIRISENAYRSAEAWQNDEFAETAAKFIKEPEFRKEIVERMRIDFKNVPDLEKAAKTFALILAELTKETK